MGAAIYHFKEANNDKRKTRIKADPKREYKIAIRQLRQSLSKEHDRKLRQERLKFENQLANLKNTQLKQMKREKEKYQREIILIRKEFKEQMRKNRNSFFRELNHLSHQLEHCKHDSMADNLPGQFETVNPEIHAEKHASRFEERPPKVNNQNQTLMPIDTVQIELILNRLKREIVDELNKRERERAFSDPSQGGGNIRSNYSSRLTEIEKELSGRDAEIKELNDNIRKLQGCQLAEGETARSAGNPKNDAQKGDHDEVQGEIFDMIREIAQAKSDQKLGTHEDSTANETMQTSWASKVSRKLGTSLF